MISVDNVMWHYHKYATELTNVTDWLKISCGLHLCLLESQCL